MEVKCFLATLGIGMVAGAAVSMMMPKQSKAYQVANDAATAIKQEVKDVVDSISEG